MHNNNKRSRQQRNILLHSKDRYIHCTMNTHTEIASLLTHVHRIFTVCIFSITTPTRLLCVTFASSHKLYVFCIVYECDFVMRPRHGYGFESRTKQWAHEVLFTIFVFHARYESNSIRRTSPRASSRLYYVYTVDGWGG